MVVDDGDLATALGSHAHRLHGIEAGLLPLLGRSNLRRLVVLAAEAANQYLVDGAEARDELVTCGRVREQLETLAQGSTHDRPVLPRLRAELFAPGDEVGVYVADTLGGAWDWVPGRVERVDKSQKPEFAGDRATRGFYWRVTIATHDGGPLACSTTEPRVILRRDLEALFHAFEDDLHFLATYCRSSDRDWAPIWAIEAGDPRPRPSRAFARWLLRGSLHPYLRELRPW